MKIFMLQTVKGSEDGLKVTKLKASTEYDLAERLAKNLIAGGLAIASDGPRPDLDAIVKGVVEEVRQEQVEPTELTTEDIEPEEPVSKFRKSKRTR